MATQAEVAAHLDLSRPSVADMAQRGVLPSAERGNLDIDACRIAYIRHLRDMAAGRGDSELSTERARLAREQADKIARENATARGESIPREDMLVTMQTTFAHVRARMLAIPSRAAPLLEGLKPTLIREKLTGLINDACDELRRTRVVPLPARRRGGGGEADGDGSAPGVDAAAEPDGKRVGRRAPRAQPGKQRRARKVVDRKD